MTPTHTRASLEEEVRRAWPAAQKHWSRFLLLAEPVVTEGLRSVAQIRLDTKEIHLDAPSILEKNLMGSVEAILAHEIGHHVRYPASMSVHARMRLLEKSLIPLDDYSLLNLFTDLLINERLGHALKDELAAVYKAFLNELTWGKDPAFVFYLSVYEELWSLMPGELIGPVMDKFAEAFPRYRIDARLLAQNLFVIGPNVYTQLLYFLSVFSAYIQPLDGEKPESEDPYACLDGEPGPEDWADALVPDAREKEAVKRALREGWLSAEEQDRLHGEDALQRRIASLPGHQSANAEIVPEVMAAYYRLQAEKYLIKPPPQPSMGEAVVPTCLEPWEASDPVMEIDWLHTFLLAGPVLGAVQPLRRNRIAEIEGYDVPFWQPRVEIYLDVSGSMPDPRASYNAMTLASQIMTLGAVRAGGYARALIYSHDWVRYWTWCRSEVEISRFLMHYVGGGTRFPFGVLQESVAEAKHLKPVRVIITDSDFCRNYDANLDKNRGILQEAIEHSSPLVLLLHRVARDAADLFVKAGAKVVLVQEMEDFPRMAVALARALFEEDRRVDF